MTITECSGRNEANLTVYDGTSVVVVGGVTSVTDTEIGCDSIEVEIVVDGVAIRVCATTPD